MILSTGNTGSSVLRVSGNLCPEVWHAHQMTASSMQYPMFVSWRRIYCIYIRQWIDILKHELTTDSCNMLDRWVHYMDVLIVWQNKGVILTHVFCWKWGRLGHLLIVTQFYSLILVLCKHFCTTLFKPDIIMCYLNKTDTMKLLFWVYEKWFHPGCAFW